MKVALRRWVTLRGRRFRLIAAIAVVVVSVGVTLQVVRVASHVEAVDPGFVGVYPAGFFARVGESELVPSVQGRLIGPHFDIAIAEVAVVDSLSSADDHPDLPDSSRFPHELRAADGHEFVVAYVGAPEIDDPEALDYFDEEGNPLVYAAEYRSELRAWIDVGSERRRLGALPEPGGVIVVSVAEDRDPHLALSDEGRSHSLSLRTGRRHHAVEGFYTNARDSLGFEYAEPVVVYDSLAAALGSSGSEQEYTVELSINEVTREPWQPDLGYAAAGRAWLRVPWVLNLPVHIYDRVDDQAMIVLTDHTGRQIPAAEGLAHPYIPVGGVLVFDVPDSFTTGTLHVSPVAGVDLAGYGWASPPPDTSVSFELTERPA